MCSYEECVLFMFIKDCVGVYWTEKNPKFDHPSKKKKMEKSLQISAILYNWQTFDWTEAGFYLNNRSK